jgi:DNA-directed RNA polymerase specialized sigma24 family protein
MENEDFPDFFAALRQRDPKAYEQLIELCGPDIRAHIRRWLSDGPLRRVVDSVDIWQSILVKFDQCIQKGQFQAETLEQLQNFLRTLARNRLRDLLRKGQVARRYCALIAPLRRPFDSPEVADAGSSPSQQVAYAELEQQFLGSLSEWGRQMYTWRAQGWTWAQIAAEVGGLPDTLRIRFDRELVRVVREMGLDDRGGAQE